MANYKFETLQLHVGQETPDPVTDARAVPIYATTSYVFHNSEHAAARFGLTDAGNIYGRLTNSTQDVLEKRLAALEGGAGCLVVCTAAEVSPEILARAEAIGCVVISTPYDTFTATSFLHQSVLIRHYMIREKIHSFTLSTPVDEAMQLMANLRHVYFPIIDDKGKYYGMLSRRNVINRRRKQLILVDHNEKTQCVPGWARWARDCK